MQKAQKVDFFPSKNQILEQTILFPKWGRKACLNLTGHDFLFLNAEKNLNTAKDNAVFFPKQRRDFAETQKADFFPTY